MELDKLLLYFREKNIQDIFLTEGERIFIRHLGEIVKTDLQCQKTIFNHLEIKFGKELYIKEDGPFEKDFSYEDHLFNRYRVNLFTSIGRKKAVIRIIKNDILDLEKMGVDERLTEYIIKNKGLSIIAGKTCSGKSTTVAGLINKIIKEKPWHIITLEDPPEYKYKDSIGIVSQRELGKDFRNYDEGIISALRQSPDLLIIGEIRDKKALTSALQAAESGTGVITTIHSKGTRLSLLRMMSMYNESEKNLLNFQLSTYLTFIQSQVLVKKEGKLKLDYELYINNKAGSNLIREGKIEEIENIIFLGRKNGMKEFEINNLT